MGLFYTSIQDGEHGGGGGFPMLLAYSIAQNSGKSKVIELLCANAASLNQAAAHAFEDAHDESLGRSLERNG